ncbi:hypothetical protein [Spirosoma spitsbergense]|jgi:hypothetical protein|uniref:hypothetical protein n=1 Tax=Spirosoma spitsbergense TaxID=431554 RepID=UPI00035DA25E|nr:hypothetical protein [Spirosoma spitsbergense]
MKFAFSLLFSLTLLAGCTPNIQVVTLRGSNVQPVEEGLVLDNDTLTLRYNFASERGRMHLSIVNKLNQPLYIDWKRSSFIIGQDKIDYWRDVSDVQLSGSSSSYATLYNRYTVGYMSGQISRDDAVGFIPPQTKLEKQQFVIVPNGSLKLPGTFTIEQEKANWVDRKKPVDVKMYTYDNDKSPLTFRNYLTLSTDKDFKTEFHIDTKFWASDVKVLPRDQVLTMQRSSQEYQYALPVPFKKADSFYVTLPMQ